MKKFIMILVLALSTAIGAYAESGDISLGVQFSYASKHSLAGLGAQVQIEPIRNFRFAPEFNYYFKNDNVSAVNVNINLHYLISTSNSFALYPIVGFAYSNFKYDYLIGDDSENCYGANVGVGAQYRIQERLHFYSEQRFQILENHNQSVTVLGLKYTF